MQIVGEMDIPSEYKMPTAYNKVADSSYDIQVERVSEYETIFNINNISDECIYGWKLELQLSSQIKSISKGKIIESYDKTYIQSEEYCYKIEPGDVISVAVYTDYMDLNEAIGALHLYSYDIVDYEEYCDILFSSQIDIDATENFIGTAWNNMELDEMEYITVDIQSVSEWKMNDECEYVGEIQFKNGEELICVNVSGKMNLCNEGMIGDLHGYYGDEPITATINYAFQSKEPYVFLAFGSLESGNDYCKVYGKRTNVNDEISNEFTDNAEQIEEVEPISVDESQSDANDIMLLASSSDYDTLARKCTYSVFTYEGAMYYLGAVSLYMPIKTKANCTYVVRAKVNAQDNNAKYYFRKKRFMPGMITYFDSDANLKIYTKSTNVDFGKASPGTTGFFDSSISVSIPFGNYLSLDLLSLNMPAAIKRTYSKLNGSTYDNQCNWRFNAHCDTNIVNNNAFTTKKGYAGYVQMVNFKNSKHTYTIVAEGTVYYRMKTQLVDYIYDCSFNVTMKASQTVTNYANN